MNNYIDTHSHLLPNIDDGVKSIDESILIINRLAEMGYTDLIITPHHNHGFKTTNEKKKELLKELQDNVKINLYLGNEVYILSDIVSDLENQILTLNDSKYLLLELPHSERLLSDRDIITSLVLKGFIPIIAHPERYLYFQRNIKVIDDYLELGCLFQGNMEAISGKYGSLAKKTFKQLLKDKKYSLIASDLHHYNSSFFTNYQKNKRKIIKIVGADSYSELYYNNPLKIIKHLDI